MTDTLSDLLANRFDEQPPELVAIKTYIKKHFDQTVALAIRDQQIIITTQSSALAGALRPHLYKIKMQSGTDKQLVIRVGH